MVTTCPRRVTRGHTAVISHNSEEKIFQAGKRQDKTDMDEAACISDALMLRLGVFTIFGIMAVLKQIASKDRRRERDTRVCGGRSQS